ncbi:MAG: alpha/beta fold hydrolase [Actinobacteria bacterium]|nr:MAG: alpha/beta fold hydrolase [Actinomycetota bacterium]
MPTHRLNGARLFYEVTGTGPWVVFAHGGEGTRLHWWAQVAALQHRFRCVTYDARGFGQSEIGDAPASDNLHRDDLLALMDHLGIERAHLVGQSMGGLAVSGVAIQTPERVDRLVMSDTPFNFATSALAEWSTLMIEKITNGFAVLDYLFAPAFDQRRPDLSYLYRALSRLNPVRDGPQGLDAYEAWRDQPIVDYRDFPVASLFIVGSEDELTLPWLMRATAAAVGGSTLVEIEGAGHSPYAEQTPYYNEVLEEFLSQSSARRAPQLLP